MANENEVKELGRNILMNLKEIKEARTEYIKALAIHQTVEQIDLESKTEVLKNTAFYEIKEDDKGIQKRILNPNSDYLMDEPSFNKYLTLCHAERTKRGLNIPDKDLTSDYESFKLLIKAEDRLFKIMLKIQPLRFKEDLNKLGTLRGTDIYKEFINICLRMELPDEGAV